MKEAYKHDFSGSCTPKSGYTSGTFSVGCFQWLPKNSRKGLKKSAVIVRVKGRSSDEKLVYAEAKRICQGLDNGIIPTKKTITVK